MHADLSRRLLGEALGTALLLAVVIGSGIMAERLSGVMGDLTDTIAILVILLLNAVIGVVQEWRADRAMQALHQLAVPHTRVRRDGRIAWIESGQLVPGDVVLLEAGDRVPADLRLIEAVQLRVDESALTGESATVMKHADALRVAVEALWDAADDDSATGGPDVGRRIWPTVALIDADGVRFATDEQVAAVVEALIADRRGNPGGVR